MLPESDPGYGFMDATTRDLALGVVGAWRGRGIGARLFDALIAVAREQGLAAVSLSLEPDNYARRMYERAGFQTVDGADGALTML